MGLHVYTAGFRLEAMENPNDGESACKTHSASQHRRCKGILCCIELATRGARGLAWVRLTREVAGAQVAAALRSFLSFPRSCLPPLVRRYWSTFGPRFGPELCCRLACGHTRDCSPLWQEPMIRKAGTIADRQTTLWCSRILCGRVQPFSPPSLPTSSLLLHPSFNVRNSKFRNFEFCSFHLNL